MGILYQIKRSTCLFPQSKTLLRYMHACVIENYQDKFDLYSETKLYRVNLFLQYKNAIPTTKAYQHLHYVEFRKLFNTLLTMYHNKKQFTSESQTTNSTYRLVKCHERELNEELSAIFGIVNSLKRSFVATKTNPKHKGLSRSDKKI